MAGNAGCSSCMSRGQFLRTAGVAGGSVAAAGLGLGGVARASGGSPSNPIVGTGDIGTDYASLQGAIASGGDVYIAGTFNLGGNTLVSGQDVNLHGINGARILGGFQTITQNGGSMNVDNIIFDGMTDAAILVYASEKTSVSNCVFSNLLFVDPSAGGWDAAITLAYTANSAGGPSAVEIKNNKFFTKTNPATMDTAFTVACVFEWFSNANAVIESNYMAGGVYSSVFDIANAGTNLITRNKMYPDQPNAISFFGGAGVWIVGWGPFGESMITHNEINCPPHNSFAFGYGDFVCSGPSVVFSNNKISIPSCFFTVFAFHGAVCNSIITNNQVNGSVTVDHSYLWFEPVGAILSTFDAAYNCDGARNNVFKGNSVAAVRVTPDPKVFDICLGAGSYGNTIVGHSGTVYDDPMNSGNVITGFNMKSAAPARVGRDVSKANRVTQDLIRRFSHREI